MKRNDDLIREILVKVEETPANQVPDPRFPDWEQNVVLEHLELLVDAGYLEAAIMRSGMGGERILAINIERMTWEGTEFLETIRNEQVWQRVKKLVAEKGGGISLEVLKSLAVEVSKQVFLSSVS